MRVAEHCARDERADKDPSFLMAKAAAELSVGLLQEAARRSDAEEARALIALFAVDPESFAALTPAMLDDAEDVLKAWVLRIVDAAEPEEEE
jgi:hypothetical protein